MPRGASLISRCHGSVEAQRCRWRRVLNFVLLLHHFLLHVDTWGHLGDCHHDATTCTQRLYPQIDQILLRQCWKHGHVDFAVDEVLHVMMQPDSSQQSLDVVVLRQLVALAWWRRVEQRGSHVEHSRIGLMSVDPGIRCFRMRFERCWRCSRDSSSLPWKDVGKTCLNLFKSRKLTDWRRYSDFTLLGCQVHSANASDNARVAIHKHCFVDASLFQQEPVVGRVHNSRRPLVELIAVIHRVFRRRVDAASASTRRSVLHHRAVGGEAVISARMHVADACSTHRVPRNLKISGHFVVLLKQWRSQWRSRGTRGTAPV